jgi:cellular nucleic acid-binding protein
LFNLCYHIMDEDLQARLLGNFKIPFLMRVPPLVKECAESGLALASARHRKLMLGRGSQKDSKTGFRVKVVPRLLTCDMGQSERERALHALVREVDAMVEAEIAQRWRSIDLDVEHYTSGVDLGEGEASVELLDEDAEDYDQEVRDAAKEAFLRATYRFTSRVYWLSFAVDSTLLGRILHVLVNDWSEDDEGALGRGPEAGRSHRAQDKAPVLWPLLVQAISGQAEGAAEADTVKGVSLLSHVFRALNPKTYRQTHSGASSRDYVNEMQMSNQLLDGHAMSVGNQALGQMVYNSLPHLHVTLAPHGNALRESFTELKATMGTLPTADLKWPARTTATENDNAVIQYLSSEEGPVAMEWLIGLYNKSLRQQGEPQYKRVKRGQECHQCGSLDHLRAACPQNQSGSNGGKRGRNGGKGGGPSQHGGKGGGPGKNGGKNDGKNGGKNGGKGGNQGGGSGAPGVGPGRGQKCFKCGNRGHISTDQVCPAKGKGPVCYTCYQPGHLQRDCPSKDGESAFLNKSDVKPLPATSEESLGTILMGSNTLKGVAHILKPTGEVVRVGALVDTGGCDGVIKRSEATGYPASERAARRFRTLAGTTGLCSFVVVPVVTGSSGDEKKQPVVKSLDLAVVDDDMVPDNVILTFGTADIFKRLRVQLDKMGASWARGEVPTITYAPDAAHYGIELAPDPWVYEPFLDQSWAKVASGSPFP